MPFEFLATCADCGMEHFFGVRFDAPLTEEELRAQITAKLGRDGALVCARPECGALMFVALDDKPIAAPERIARAEAAQRIGQRTVGIRFAVGDPAGPRSAVWRVWMNNRRDDVYIAARGLASDLKVSLHPDYWYYGFTSKHAASSSSLIPPGSDRKKYVWDRPGEFGAGWTRAFEIVVPASEVVSAPEAYVGSEAVWFPTPDTNESMHFTVLLSKPDAARGRRGFPTAEGAELTTELVTRLSMSTGETLWIVAHSAPTPAEQAQQRRARVDLLAQVAREGLGSVAMPRALVFAQRDDGVPAFIDLSLSLPTDPGLSLENS
jgi:hypothetical protein